MLSGYSLLKSINAKKVKVFVVLGALQAVAVEQIFKQFDTEKGVNICLNCSSVELRLPTEVIQLNVGRGGYWETVFQYWGFYQGFRRLRRAASRFEIAIPHVYHALTNYLAFELCPDAIDLLPDGLLNYRNSCPTKKQLNRMKVKSFFAWILGGRYWQFTGNITGMEKLSYRSHYVFDPRAVYTAVGARRLISLPSLSVKKDGLERVLILDQPLENLGEKNRCRIQKALGQYLGADAGQWVYKPHRDQKKMNVVLDPDSTTLVLSGKDVIEYLVQDLNVTKVVSVYSSALVTLKVMCPSLPCVSVGANVIAEECSGLEQSIDALSVFGVELVDAE